MTVEKSIVQFSEKLATLEELIISNLNPRELKRAFAIKMQLQGIKHREIPEVVLVHLSYISRLKKIQRGRIRKNSFGMYI